MTTDSTPSQHRPRVIIRAAGSTMSFTVADSQAPGGLLHEAYTVRSSMSVAANLRQAFGESELLSRGWSRAMLLLGSEVMVVPVEEFQRSTIAALYQRTFTGMEGRTVVSNMMPGLNAVAVYSVGKDLRTVMEDHFENVKFNHLCIPVWDALHRRSYNGTRRKLYAYYHEKALEVFCFHQNRFRFCNRFAVSRTADITYYLLAVWKQLGMDQQKDELHLAGAWPDRDELLMMLHQYLHNAYVVNPSADFNRAPITQMEGMPYDLMCLMAGSVRKTVTATNP